MMPFMIVVMLTTPPDTSVLSVLACHAMPYADLTKVRYTQLMLLFTICSPTLAKVDLSLSPSLFSYGGPPKMVMKGLAFLPHEARDRVANA